MYSANIVKNKCFYSKMEDVFNRINTFSELIQMSFGSVVNITILSASVGLSIVWVIGLLMKDSTT